MFDPEIQIKRNSLELNEAAAELFIRLAHDSINAYRNFSVALSGGSTPRSLYALLASEKYRSSISWELVSFFFGDERAVPPDSDESNYRMAHETLLGPLRISEEQIHRWQTELSNINDAAAIYETDLCKYLERSKRGLDLILLGLGDDAHTASLFPHSPALHEKERLAVANHIEKLNSDRLTMTFPLINSAANIVFLVAGSSKAEAVAQVIEGQNRPDDYPAQMVKPEKGRVTWLLDEDAAALLNQT
ncbi:MAG: 6-phosphogluconolactonase [Pyrinomonadaceae bacterium]